VGRDLKAWDWGKWVEDLWLAGGEVDDFASWWEVI